MPLNTIGRLLGIQADSFDPPFARAGFEPSQGGWSGTLHDTPVRIERLLPIPLVRMQEGLRIGVPLPWPLRLGPPDGSTSTQDRDFDAAFSLPVEQRGRVSDAMRRQLVRLADTGTVQVVEGKLVWERVGNVSSAKRALSTAGRVARIATTLREDAETLAELVRLEEREPTTAIRLARRIRGRNQVPLDLRVHADALVRRGRKLIRIVEGAALPDTARCWAAERLPKRYADDVVDELLDRPRTPGDLRVLAVLATHHEVALLLAHHERFWDAELAKASDPDRAEALATLLAVLVQREPGSWIDHLLPRLPRVEEPLHSVALDAVAKHGSRLAFHLIGPMLETRIHRTRRRAWQRVQAELRDRFGGNVGAISLAEGGGDLAVAQPPHDSGHR